MKNKSNTIILIINALILLIALGVHFAAKRFMTFSRMISKLNHSLKAITNLDILIKIMFWLMVALFLIAILSLILKRKFYIPSNLILTLTCLPFIFLSVYYLQTKNPMIVKSYYLVPLLLSIGGIIQACAALKNNLDSRQNPETDESQKRR